MVGTFGMNAYAIRPTLMLPLAAAAASLGCLVLLITVTARVGTAAFIPMGQLSTALCSPTMVTKVTPSVAAMCTEALVSTSHRRRI